MKHLRLAELLSQPQKHDDVTVRGWVRTFRANRFIALNDGSTIENLQCVVDFENTDESLLRKINTGAAVEITGQLVESMGKGQSQEVLVETIEIVGEADPDHYPIQPKKHSFEFLREKAHLRVRTATFSAVMRIRSVLSFAIHQFFQDKGFCYVHTPIITGSDAEGAGEMFRVSVLDPQKPPVDADGAVDFKQDFFGKETNLTVSGQLEAETYAQGLGNVYTFGPTFRAENSNTSRHLAEFWMIEPEMAFYDLNDNMDLAEEFIKYTLTYILEKCEKDLLFLHQR
jgi:asparaginyl-tRNA synthetase